MLCLLPPIWRISGSTFVYGIIQSYAFLDVWLEAHGQVHRANLLHISMNESYRLHSGREIPNLPIWNCASNCL